MQMRWEEEAAIMLGIPWRVKVYSAEKMEWDSGYEKANQISLAWLPGFQKLLNWLILRVGYYRRVIKKSKQVDLIILRYSSYDPFQFFVALLLGRKLCFVHHTLEVPELRLDSSLIGKVKVCTEGILGRYVHSRALGVIGVTREIVDYEIARASRKPTHAWVYPNGITWDVWGEDDCPRQESEHLNILFVASHFYPWHGLDLLLTNLKSSQKDFKLHLVGELSRDDLLQAKDDDRVVIYGTLQPSEICSLSKSCAIGISSLALWRNGMREATPLKTREYLLAGTAVYGNYIDVFPEDYEFFKRGDISIGEILLFSRQVSKYERTQIRASAAQYIDKVPLVRRLYRDLSNLQSVHSKVKLD